MAPNPEGGENRGRNNEGEAKEAEAKQAQLDRNGAEGELRELLATPHDKVDIEQAKVAIDAYDVG